KRLLVIGGAFEALLELLAEQLRIFAGAVESQIPIKFFLWSHVDELVHGGGEVAVAAHDFGQRRHLEADGIEAQRAAAMRHATGHQRLTRRLANGRRDVTVLETVAGGGEAIELWR